MNELIVKDSDNVYVCMYSLECSDGQLGLQTKYKKNNINIIQSDFNDWNWWAGIMREIDVGTNNYV